MVVGETNINVKGRPIPQYGIAKKLPFGELAAGMAGAGSMQDESKWQS